MKITKGNLMEKYTEKEHATRVRYILEREYTCTRCPADLEFGGLYGNYGIKWPANFDKGKFAVCVTIL